MRVVTSELSFKVGCDPIFRCVSTVPKKVANRRRFGCVANEGGSVWSVGQRRNATLATVEVSSAASTESCGEAWHRVYVE